MKIRNLFLFVLFVCIVAPLAAFNWERDSVSEIDNRKLTEFDWQASDKTNMIEDFVKDRIGFRSVGIDVFTEGNDRLFGEMVHPTYTYGKDGYVFFKLGAEKVDTEFVDAFCSYLKRVQDYCEARDIPFLYCINPSKTTVYNRYLPQGYTYKNEFIETLYSALERYGIHYISNVELLTEKSFSEQVYNVKYDAGHWNDRGCFYGTNHLLEEVSKDFPSVTAHKWEDFHITEKTETTLPVSHFAISEKVPYFENPAEENLEIATSDFYAVKLDRNHRAFGVFRNHNAGSSELPRVLFFHGSYYNSRVRFYDTSFQETYVVHNYQNFIDFDYYFNLFRPECVILESAEYATTRGYFDVSRLQDKKLNPVYDSVRSKKHIRNNLAEFSYQIDTQEAITTISLELKQPCSFGYLRLGEELYDLQIAGDQAVCAIQTEWMGNVKPEEIEILLFEEPV